MRSLLDGLAGLFLGLDLLQGVLVGEVDAALLVDIGDLDPDHVADVDHVLHLLHPAVGQLGDVDHAVLAGGQLDEGAELEDADHLAVVELAHLGHKHDGLDGLLGGVAGGLVGARDIDGAVVLDVDLGAGVRFLIFVTFQLLC